MTDQPSPRRRSRLKVWLRRLAVVAASGTLLLAVIGFLVGPPIARHVAQKQLGQLLGRKVTIGRVRINPFALSVTVLDFRVFEPDQITPFVGFSRLYVNAQLSSLFHRGPVIKEMALQSLRLHVVREKATAEAWADVAAAYNFSDIVARLQAMPKAPETPPPADAAPPRFSLNNIHVDDLAVTFDDRPSGDHHEITELSVGVPFVSTFPAYVDSFVEPGFRVRIDGTPFEVKGRTKPFKDSLETVLELRLNALDLTRYVPFVPVRLPFSVQSARLSLALDIGFVRPREDAPKLTVEGDITLAKLDVEERRRGAAVLRAVKSPRDAPPPLPGALPGPGNAGLMPLAALDKLAVRVAESDLTHQNIHVESVLVSGLDVHLRRLRDGSLNVEHLQPGTPPPADDAGGEEKPGRAGRPRPPQPSAAPRPSKRDAEEGPRFALDHFTLEKSAIHFRDQAVEPAFAADVTDIAMSANGLSNAPGATAHVTASLRATPGGTLRQQGTLRLTPLAAKGTVSLEGIAPGRFEPYYDNLLQFGVRSGTVRLGASYELEQGATASRQVLRVHDAFLGIADLALRRRGARDDFFQLTSLDVRGGKADLAGRTVAVDEIATRGGRLRIGRDARGVVDLTTLTAASASGEPPTGRDAPGAPDARDHSRPSDEPPAAPWTVSVARFDLERWGARFEDRAVTPTAVLTVDPMALHLTDLSTASGAKMGIDLRLGINKTARLRITGSSTLPPVVANVRFELRGLDLVPLQPYFQDQVSLTVTDGALTVAGQANVKLPANGPPRFKVAADIDVNELTTVDREQKEPLLGWKAFHVGGLNVASPPVQLSIADVSLDGPQAHLVLSPGGRFNLADAFAKPGAPATHKAPAAAAPAVTAARQSREPTGPDVALTTSTPTASAASGAADAAPQVKINRVTLSGGQVTFTDRTIRPSVSAELTDLAGRVSGLSSTGGTTADVDIHGTVNRSGALAISGSTNPLAKALALDVQVNVKDVELPPASPYTGKYAGYGISKGKLDLALSYKIAGRKLDANNKLVLDQFTFGEKVDSPDAVKLPVRLAVALLKDRHGVIDIDVPIAGSLDDPQFKVWRAILKVLGNLVVKAVTAPFSLLASAFGGGDELSHIDFPAGAATLDAVAGKRLATLAKVLRERPGISFEVEASADPQRDREGLRRFLFERKLKAKKLASIVESGAAAPSLDDISIDPTERPALLESVYKTEKFPKPKNVLGMDKHLPPAEMESLILQNTAVDTDQLRALALRRATLVQSTLAKAVPGAASRVYLLSPRVGASRAGVELKLKKD